jgi:hypothetical protein
LDTTVRGFVSLPKSVSWKDIKADVMSTGSGAKMDGYAPEPGLPIPITDSLMCKPKSLNKSQQEKSSEV